MGIYSFVQIIAILPFPIDWGRGGHRLGHIGSDPAADFYSPLTRFWELMAGAVLAYLSLHWEDLTKIFRKLPRPVPLWRPVTC